VAKKRTVILGAAGKDFHVFNTLFREDAGVEVVAFTATQIPDIAGRRYPASLAGPHYPEGIPILPEEEVERLVLEEGVREAVFAYSDVSHENVMHLASRINALGADFRLPGAEATMLEASVPVVSVCAVRTGCGKSQTTRRIADILRAWGRKVVVIRHPMPYGDLEAMKVQRFAEMEDMDRHDCTIEEREEYEHHVHNGTVVYAGVDYGAILEQAAAEADVILWDGGNNDTPFYKPDLEIVVVDPHRPGDEVSYHPGETNLRRADVVLINKVGTAYPEDMELVYGNILAVNPRARVIEAASPVHVDEPERIRGARVLVVEDGPTVTHGEMAYGAGTVAARKFGAEELVDPRPWAVGSIAATFEKYPAIGSMLPAMGYGEEQQGELKQTIEACDCDLVVVGTPIDLAGLLDLGKPSVRVTYSLQEIGRPNLEDVLGSFREG